MDGLNQVEIILEQWHGHSNFQHQADVYFIEFKDPSPVSVVFVFPNNRYLEGESIYVDE